MQGAKKERRNPPAYINGTGRGKDGLCILPFSARAQFPKNTVPQPPCRGVSGAVVKKSGRPHNPVPIKKPGRFPRFLYFSYTLRDKT